MAINRGGLIYLFFKLKCLLPLNTVSDSNRPTLRTFVVVGEVGHNLRNLCLPRSRDGGRCWCWCWCCRVLRIVRCCYLTTTVLRRFIRGKMLYTISSFYAARYSTTSAARWGAHPGDIYKTNSDARALGTRLHFSRTLLLKYDEKSTEKWSQQILCRQEFLSPRVRIYHS